MSAAAASERATRSERGWGDEKWGRGKLRNRLVQTQDRDAEEDARTQGRVWDAPEDARPQAQERVALEDGAPVQTEVLGHPTVHSHRSPPEHTHPDDVPLTTALAALADPMRLRLVRELADSDDWERTCGSFDVPIGKAALSHHFAVLRAAGLLEQRDFGTRRANRLRREEFERRFPGLLKLVLRDGQPS